jgi:hypothetical protein
MTKASIPTLLHKRISIRRSGKVVRNVLTHLLVPEIKQGRLKGDDEISADEKYWVRLDRHHQLARFFLIEPSSDSKNPSPNMEQRLTDLSEMLKDLNQ